MADRPIVAGERFADITTFAQRGGDGPNLWKTLGFRRTEWRAGGATVEWDATVDYGFVTASGPVIQGGLVTAILDSAMGGACWTTLDNDEVFLTADLRVEFLRPTRPGLIRATGHVVRRTSRVVFCAAELFDADGTMLAGSRCTQVLLPA
ncbi:MAG TPA: PaaI family thioesterase [Micromonosporaceae bacterium]|jgi:uncharacterized protein (TIGR00369 family)